MVVSQHRLPECITNDHDSQFHHQFWDELISLLDITLTFSIASYPQADGMTEEMNYIIKQLLQIYA